MSVKTKSYVPQAIKAVTAGTEKALLETAIKVTSQAKQLTPVDTGQLRNSLMWKTEQTDGGNTGGPKLTEPVKGVSVIDGTAVEHGVYQEYGTRKMAAQPFLRTAIDIVTNGVTAERAAAKAMNDTVREKLARVSAGFAG